MKKNLILDLGGVLIAVDYSKTEKAFADLGIENFNQYFKQNFSSTLFEQLEKGEITPSRFYNEFRNLTHTTLSNQVIESAWNAMLGNFYTYNIQLLTSLANRFNLYLFSNTNLIHYLCFQEIFNQQFPDLNLNNHFIQAFYSHEVHLRKPEVSAFEHILGLAHLEKSNSFFIDDTAINVEGANQAGLHGILLTNPTELELVVNSI